MGYFWFTRGRGDDVGGSEAPYSNPFESHNIAQHSNSGSCDVLGLQTGCLVDPQVFFSLLFFFFFFFLQSARAFAIAIVFS